jgi:hypothetical protein
MKTVMKEMIQNIIDIESKTYNQEQLYMLTALKVFALILLEKEKEQIQKSYKDHHDLGHIYGLDTEQYYNQTYNQNK